MREEVCGGGAQSARSWVMGTLGILGSKFLKILKLMGTLVGAFCHSVGEEKEGVLSGGGRGSGGV